jgi:hypothetical protein
MKDFAGAVLLVIREQANDMLFGSFATEPLVPHSRHFGTGECFLFSVDRKGKVVKYGATGKNDYYMLATPDLLASGCGDGAFGLWLDKRLLSGGSKPSPTFDNLRLSAADPFRVQSVEVWGLKAPRVPRC